MAGDKESTLIFKVDGTQAETGVAKVKSSLHDLADTASREGQRGASGIAGMGAGAEKSAAQIERATQRQISEIRRMTAELESGGKATRAYQEAMASIRGVDASALRPYLDQLEQARTKMGQVGTTAGEMSNALRTVPMQFTDIVTSLASGQNAFTVFIQQGGQLKDMFGGVGVAAKALGTYVLGLINPFTLAAGAAALLATAYYQGSKESAAYNTAIAMSGNAAGVTAGQLGDMARAMESATRTRSAASAAVAEMAQNSRVGSDELQRYTAVAMDFEKVTGTAVSKTAEAFASLAKEPLQAAIKLNDGVNWLTTSTNENIKALVEQGKSTAAARVAQEAYADSIAQKTAQLQGNLGALERGWNAVTGAAKRAWDAMLNAGRASTQADKILSIDRDLADLQSRNNAGFSSNGGGAAFGRPDAAAQSRVQARIQALQAEKAAIAGVMEAEKKLAEQQAAANAQVQARIALDSKYGDKLKTDSQKAKAARDEIAELGKAAGKSAEEIKRLQDASDATFNRGGGGGRKGGGAGRTSAAPGENEIARIKAMIEEEQRYIAALQERGKEAEKLTAGEKLVLKLQQELQTSMSGVAKANKEKALSAAQELVSVEKLRVAEEKRIKTDEENRKRLIASIDEERAARMKMAEENAKRVDAIGKDNERMREEIETLGMSAAQIAARTIEVNNATIAEKENQLARLQNDNISTREMAALEEEIKLLKERNGLIGQRSQKNEMLEAQRAQLDMWKSIDQTAHDVFVNIFEDGAGTFKRLGQTLKSAVLDMLYQLTIKRWIINIGASFSGNPASFAQAMGGQGGGLLGNAGSAYNMFTGVVGNLGANAVGSIAANAMSGVGMYGGNSLSAFLATNGAYGTAGTGVGML
ncbi:MAG: phage tail length tape measure family protein, partial [Propionivibrio sp.]|nr:phage tail length tape measure family protein [Propionivibrio sp.]